MRCWDQTGSSSGLAAQARKGDKNGDKEEGGGFAGTQEEAGEGQSRVIALVPTSLISVSHSETALTFQFEAPLWQSDSITTPVHRECRKKEGWWVWKTKRSPRTTQTHSLENNFLLWIFKTSNWRIAFSFPCCLSSQ